MINAGTGDDLIAGGSGRDVMTGGAGSDSFVFNAGESRPTLGGSGNGGTISGHDVITDFDLATDLLNLPGTPRPDGSGPVNRAHLDPTTTKAAHRDRERVVEGKRV